MPDLTKTEINIHVNANGAFSFRQLPGYDIQIGMGTDDFGPVHRQLTAEERLGLLEVLDYKRELAAGWDARKECKLLRERLEAAQQEAHHLRRALRLLRDFTSHATQWVLGCHKHPIWAMVVNALQDDNSLRPSKREWAFLWPENKEPLGDG